MKVGHSYRMNAVIRLYTSRESLDYGGDGEKPTILLSGENFLVVEVVSPIDQYHDYSIKVLAPSGMGWFSLRPDIVEFFEQQRDVKQWRSNFNNWQIEELA